MKIPHTLRALVYSCLLLSAVGCRPIGPDTVVGDRFDYGSAISDSWKRQTLLNIVKLRYYDSPSFLEVGQIVAGYSLETGGTASGQLSTSSLVPGNSVVMGLGTAVRFTDRPTITYTPLTGNKFLKGLMTPLLPEAVFFLIQSGLPADALLYATTSSICGLKNQESTMGAVAPPSPDFLRALELMRKLQLSDAVGLRIIQGEKQQTTLLTITSSHATDETRAWSSELRRLLQINPEGGEFKLVYGAVAANPNEVAVRTRSILQILNTMAVQVEVPEEDIAEGRATPGLSNLSEFPARLRLVRIRSSKEVPGDAFVSVYYRNTWFYIDDRDLATKRIFSFMMMLFTLADTGEQEPLLLITIPAQ